ncbi:MAG: 50S ribosomal protein L24e [Thermoplasmatales archaeon]|nr:50S ribosomal protein L24e [Thermoplasmatales archaeon]
MAEAKICSFCGAEIERGTGRMHVRRDGNVLNFCTKKCFKNMVELKRVPRTTEWTAKYAEEKSARLRAVEKKE